MKTWDFEHGTVVFLSISLVITPPIVSRPSDNGVTSKSNISFTSPMKTPPWTAAPKATTSSGFTDEEAAFSKNFSTVDRTSGILVEPPTRRISSISLLSRDASLRALRTGSIVLDTNLSIIFSKLDLVKSTTKCLGPVWSAVKNGKLILVC